MARRMRTVKPVLPAQTGVHEGLSYTLWLPGPGHIPTAGIVILHGAGSCKENHHDFARAAVAAGFAAVAFDQRGHGESQGPMDSSALADVVAMAELLRARTREALPIVLRGSSMGGYLAILTAVNARADAVVAICPASGEGLVRALRSGRLGFEADVRALEGVLSGHDLHAAARALSIPVLLLHAEGDEQVPVQHSRELAEGLANPRSRLVVVPGGHHRSVQHDPELNALSLRFVQAAVARP